MKVTPYKSEDEKLVLLGLITSTAILGQVLAGLKGEPVPFANDYANTIFRWCSEFYQKHGRAPRGAIRTLFLRYAAKPGRSAAQLGLLERFLQSLDKDARQLVKGLNRDFVVDLASSHFDLVRHGRLRDDLEQALQVKDLAAARETVSRFNPVAFAASDAIDVLTDRQAWLDALEAEEAEVLVHYPGALGEFFGHQLSREGFVSFLAPEKRGKTFWLLDVAWRALRERRRVFFFSAGDMSRKGMLRRLMTRAARRPLREGKVMRPRKIRLTSTRQAQVQHEAQSFTKPISRKQLLHTQKELHRLSAAKHSLLKLSAHSNSSLTVAAMRQELDEAIRFGWVPDVVVVDYMDILAPEAGSHGQDFRHQTNETWKAMRRLSQDYHVLVVTATQADAASYEAKVITRQNFSEDKRKLSHVTGMVGINQTEIEKQQGLYRLNWVLLREGDYYETRCVWTAACLTLSNPAVKSIW